MRRALWALVAGTLLSGFSCGGREPLTVHPKEATVAVGEALQFSVTPTTTAVTWAVQEAGGGAITPTGLYTAPGTSGTYHVIATASPSVSASATVTVTSAIQIAAASPQQFDACVPKKLVATVTGSIDTGVVWTGMDPACGAVAADGTFTPARVSGSCTVQASAHADPGKFVLVQADIAAERVLGVAIAPPAPSVSVNGTVQFAATVTTSCGTFPAGQ